MKYACWMWLSRNASIDMPVLRSYLRDQVEDDGYFLPDPFGMTVDRYDLLTFADGWPAKVVAALHSTGYKTPMGRAAFNAGLIWTCLSTRDAKRKAAS